MKRTMRIWTIGYFPFRFGPPKGPMSIEWEVDGPHDLGSIFVGFVATAPNGKTFVVEMRSEAIIGPSLEIVREDVATAQSFEIMEKQVEEAIELGKSAVTVSTDEFWRQLKGLK